MPVTLTFDAPPVSLWDYIPVAVQATIVGQTIDFLMVTATYPALGLTEVVHDGSNFGPKYIGGSNIRSTIVDGFQVRCLRIGGWPDTTVILRAYAHDSAGGFASGSQTYTATPAQPQPVSSVSVVTLESVENAGELPRIRDLLLDSITGDLVVDNGDLALATDLDAIAQELRLRFGFFRNEWFLDLDAGMPYYERILIKNPNLVEVREWFRLELVATPGVLDITELDVQYTGNRTALVSFSVTTDVGELSQVVEV